MTDIRCSFLANGQSRLALGLNPGELTMVMGEGLVPVAPPTGLLSAARPGRLCASALDAVAAAQPLSRRRRWAGQSTGGERSVALACLARVGLLDRALFPVDSLSAAERWRVALAALLIQRARLLPVADPDGELFDFEGARFLCLLRAVSQEQGRAAVVFTGVNRAVAGLADRVVVIAEAQRVFDGAPNALPGGLPRAEPTAASPDDRAVQRLSA